MKLNTLLTLNACMPDEILYIYIGQYVCRANACELLNEQHTNTHKSVCVCVSFKAFTFTQIITVNCLSLICARENLFIYKHGKFTAHRHPGRLDSIYVHFQFIHFILTN